MAPFYEISFKAFPIQLVTNEYTIFSHTVTSNTSQLFFILPVRYYSKIPWFSNFWQMIISTVPAVIICICIYNMYIYVYIILLYM